MVIKSEMSSMLQFSITLNAVIEGPCSVEQTAYDNEKGVSIQVNF